MWILVGSLVCTDTVPGTAWQLEQRCDSWDSVGRERCQLQTCSSSLLAQSRAQQPWQGPALLSAAHPNSYVWVFQLQLKPSGLCSLNDCICNHN